MCQSLGGVLPEPEMIIKLRNYFESGCYYGCAGLLEVFYLQNPDEQLAVNKIVLTGIRAKYGDFTAETDEVRLYRVNIEEDNLYQELYALQEHRSIINPLLVMIIDAIMLEALQCHLESLPPTLFTGFELE